MAPENPAPEKTITTLDDAISAAADKVFEANDAPDQNPENPEVKSDTKPRDESGKFQKTKAAKEAPVEEKLNADGGDDKGQTQDAVKAAVPASAAPQSWSAAAKAQWDTLPPDIRAEALRVETATQKLMQTHASEKKQWDTIGKIIEPKRNALAASYGSVDNGLQTLFALSDFAEKDPYGFVTHFAQRRGLNLSSLIPSQGQTAQTQVSPEIAALMQQVAELKNGLNQREQESLTQRQQVAQKSYDEFMKTDPTHFEDVRLDMAALVDAGLATSFQDAYDKAVWARPDIRETLIASQRQEALEASRREADEAAKKAKKVSTANASTKAFSGGTSSPKRTLDETITAVANGLMN